MKNFKIGDKLTRFPLIQGGMGVGISLGRLAGTVAKEGGIGIISTAQIGYREKDFDRNTEEANQRAILSEMKKARRISPDGIIGYNIMVALKEYASHVKAAVHAGADLIISGAGLPTELPALVSGSKTKIAPIVSTDKSAKVILKYWERKYKRTADLVVIEGPQAGGHLGFHKEELDSYTPEAYDNEIRKIVQTALDRNRKKLSLQQKQMKDTEKKDKYKVYGELINTYGYGLEEGCKSFKAVNYYNGEEITIPLDPTLTPQENSKKYFDRYGKLKRTQEALEVQIADTTSEIEHLESISNALDIAAEESDLSQIKEELMEYNSSLPIYLQVANLIKRDIVTGKRELGEKLPSVRELAVSYTINPNTVSRVYKELETEGVCFTRRGMGTFVTEDSEKVKNMKEEMAGTLIHEFLEGMQQLGFTKTDVIRILKKKEESGE